MERLHPLLNHSQDVSELCAEEGCIDVIETLPQAPRGHTGRRMGSAHCVTHG